MVDVMDDFTASMFLLLHGYYRQSIAALRSVLETTAIGVYLELLNDKVEFGRWRRGIKEIGFGHAADRLRALPVVSAFEMRLRAAAQDDLFAQRSRDSEGGWSRRLYGRLCEYTHSRPGRTNSDLWRSNGPIYVRRHVNLVGSLYSETFTLSMLLLRFARPGQTGPRGFERNYSASARAHMLFVPLNCVSITSGFPWTSVGAMMAHWVSGPDQRQLSARLARCRPSRRRSVDRTDSNHSTVAAATALHVPKRSSKASLETGLVGWEMVVPDW